MDALSKEKKNRPRCGRESWLSASGAGEIAYQVNEYWLGLGAVVDAKISPIPGTPKDRPAFQVRSDLIGGFPPNWTSSTLLTKLLKRGSK